jgi:Flp pilus assembly protein TadD
MTEKTHLNAGFAHIKDRKYPQALLDFSEALKLNPESVEAYTGKGIVYEALKNYDFAITNFEKAVLLDPESPAVYSNRGCCLIASGITTAPSPIIPKPSE